MWDLIVSVPDHCLSFYFSLLVSIGDGTIPTRGSNAQIENDALPSFLLERWTWGGERGGSVVECRTPEREVRGSRPTSAVLCPWARHFTPRKYWLITQEAMAPSRHDWKIVDWDVKPQHNQPRTWGMWFTVFNVSYTVQTHDALAANMQNKRGQPKLFWYQNVPYDLIKNAHTIVVGIWNLEVPFHFSG